MSVKFGDSLQEILFGLYKSASEHPSEDGSIRIDAIIKDDRSLAFLVDLFQRVGDRLNGKLEVSEAGADGSYDCSLVMDMPDSCKDIEFGAADLASGDSYLISYKRGSYKKKLCVPKGCVTVAEAAQAYEDHSLVDLGVSESTRYRRLKDLKKLVAQGRSDERVETFYALVEL